MPCPRVWKAHLIQSKRTVGLSGLASSANPWTSAGECWIPQSRYRYLLWLDAIGLALFAVTGAEKAAHAGADVTVAIAMGAQLELHDVGGFGRLLVGRPYIDKVLGAVSQDPGQR
jgi:uncharacterized membrane protein YeiH